MQRYGGATNSYSALQIENSYIPELTLFDIKIDHGSSNCLGCGLQVVWVFPEKLRKELSRLDSLQAYGKRPYVSTVEYISHGQYLSYVINMIHSCEDNIMIEIRVNELLGGHGKSFYWLAKETGISHTTLWRLKKGKALGINFDTLEKLCEALNCQTGEVLALANDKKGGKARQTRKKKR